MKSMRPIFDERTFFCNGGWGKAWVHFVTLVALAGGGLVPTVGSAEKKSGRPSAQRSGANAGCETGNAKRGAVAYRQVCAFCHGERAGGGESGPNLRDSRLVRQDRCGNAITPVIQTGRPSKGMPPFGSMNSGELRDLVAYLHEVSKESLLDNMTSTRISLKNLLTGDAAKGKVYFYGIGKCTSCHSATGDLAHIAGKYDPLELEARMSIQKTFPGRRRSGSLQRTRYRENWSMRMNSSSRFGILPVGIVPGLRKKFES